MKTAYVFSIFMDCFNFTSKNKKKDIKELYEKDTNKALKKDWEMIGKDINTVLYNKKTNN